MPQSWLVATCLVLALLSPSSCRASEEEDTTVELDHVSDGPILNLDFWPTEHHDVKNSGRVDMHFNFTGYNGSCLEPVASTADPSAIFGHTGVTANDMTTLYTGTSSGTLLFVDLELRQVVHNVKVVDNGGIAASPALAWSKTLSEDVLYVGSTQGIVYCVRPSACTSLTDAHEDDAGECIVWEVDLGAPVLTAPRMSQWGADTGSLPDGQLYVSTTNQTEDSDGVLYALNATDGSVQWNRPTLSYGASVASMYLPAVDETRGVLYMAYGAGVYVIEPATGDNVTFALGDVHDHFVSSVTVNAAADALYVASASGTLWRYDIKGLTLKTLTLSFAWSCFYPYNGGDAKCNNGTNPVMDGYGHVLSPAPLDDLPDPWQVGLPIQYNLPYSTPSLSPLEEDVVYALYGQESGALIIADDVDGSLKYVFTGIENVTFGLSKSSAAVDNRGDIVIGSDSKTGTLFRPVFWGLDVNNDRVKFVTPVGLSGETVASSSPLLSTLANGEELSAFGVDSEVFILETGYSCPSNSALDPCSGNGDCDCTTGQCKCHPCFTGDDCSQPLECGAGSNGKGCDPKTGTCTCKNCYYGPTCETHLKCENAIDCNADQTCNCKKCFVGDFCEKPLCGDHGTCGALGKCSCDPCYSGDACEILETCNGNGNCNNSTGTCDCINCKTGTKCTLPRTCSLHGQCEDNACSCNDHWAGEECDVCHDCYSGDLCDVECSGSGFCKFGQCVCDDGYGGQKCEQQCPICLTGKECITVDHCNEHGMCGVDTGCVCNAGFTGPHCAEPTAMPTPSLSSTPAPHSGGGGGGNAGKVAGGVIGGLVVAGALVAGFYYRRPIADAFSRKSSGGFSTIGGGGSSSSAAYGSTSGTATSAAGGGGGYGSL